MVSYSNTLTDLEREQINITNSLKNPQNALLLALQSICQIIFVTLTPQKN